MSLFDTAIGVREGYSEVLLVSPIVRIYLCKRLGSAREKKGLGNAAGHLKLVLPLHVYAASGLPSCWREM